MSACIILLNQGKRGLSFEKLMEHQSLYTYCWCKKSCTTWDVKNRQNGPRINYLPTGDRWISEPSTVVLWVLYQFISIAVLVLWYNGNFHFLSLPVHLSIKKVMSRVDTKRYVQVDWKTVPKQRNTDLQVKITYDNFVPPLVRVAHHVCNAKTWVYIYIYI